jgi:MFS family permease
MSSVADGLPLNKRLPAVIAISLGIGMATLDTAIVNTALPTLADGIGTDSASVIWVVNAYQLAIIATVLPFASLSDVLGHRRVYLGGLLLFIVSSLFCGIAGSLVTLTAARVVQGLGAAAIMSVNTALLRHIYPSRMLGRGLGYNSLVVGLAFTLGPTAASAILSVASWHWLYLINVPLGLLALMLGLRSLPVIPMAGHAFDRLAALLCAGLFALLVLGLGTAVHGAQGALTPGPDRAGAGLRRAAAAPPGRAPGADAGSGLVQAPGVCAVFAHGDLRLQCPGPGLCVAAVSAAGSARAQPGGDRLSDDALACGGGGDGLGRRAPGRPRVPRPVVWDRPVDAERGHGGPGDVAQ